ncbi:MAG: RND family transporter [Deltaproteobacteria bacterium]|nr:RND family transporter [Deltaproteobacteria bacterium]
MRFPVEWILRNAPVVIAATVALTIASCVAATGVVFDFNMENLLPDRHPERVVYEEFQKQFGEDDATYLLAVEATDVFAADVLRDVRDLSLEFRNHPAVEEVLSLTTFMFPRVAGDQIDIRPFVEVVPDDPATLETLRAEALANPFLPENLVSKDTKTTAIAVRLRSTSNNHEARAEFETWFRERMAAYAKPDRAFHLGGTPVLRTAYIHYAQLNILIFTPLVILMLIVVLWFTQRSAAGVLLPLATVAAATLMTVALMRLTGVTINLLTNVVPSIILVYGISDAIHLMVKYKEEYAQVPDRRRALISTTRKIVIACFWTSATTAVGFGSLFTSSNKVVREFGFITAAGVMIAYIINVVFVPAVLSRIAPPTPERTRAFDHGTVAEMLRRITDLVIRRPKPIVGIGVGLMLVAALGAAMIEREYYFMQDLRPETEIRQSYEYLDRHLGSAVPFEISVKSRSGRPVTDPAVLREIDRIATRMREIPEMGKVLSLAEFVKEMQRLLGGGGADVYRIPETREAVSQSLLLYSMSSPDPTAPYMTFDETTARISARTPDMGQRRFDAVSKELRRFVASDIDPDLDVHITGAGPMIVVLVDRLVIDMVTSLLSAFGIIFFMMWFEFRSLGLSGLSMIPNLIPLVYVAGLMGFAGVTLNPTTAVTFCIALGIAVDDTIHFLVRFRYEYAQDEHHANAVRRSMRGTGRAMVFTSVVLVMGYLVLVTSNFKANRDFGWLSALMIAIALLADLFVTPALILLAKPKIRHRDREPEV